MNARRQKLLMRNYLDAKKEGLEWGYDITLVDKKNIEHYYILLKPTKGIYRNQTHVLELKTSYGTQSSPYIYPMQKPDIKFLTKIYHTNVSSQGTICVDMLTNPKQWMPTYSFHQVLLNIMLLYEEQNPASPYNSQAGSMYANAEKKYQQGRKQFTGDDLDAFRNECFDEMRIKSELHATNDLTKFAKWFPQLAGGQDQHEEELAKLQVLCANMKIGKKERKHTDKKKKRFAKFKKKPVKE